MATIQQIETNLLNASRAGNVTLLNSTLASITTAQIGVIDPSVLGQSLRNITFLSNDATAATMTRSLMAKLGAGVHGIEIGAAAQMFAASGNYAALDALTDYLTSAQKTQADPGDLGRVVREIVFNDNPGSTSDDATHANALRDFMAKLGSKVHGIEIGAAAQMFAASGNYAALDALTDYLTSAQKTQADPGDLGRVVREIVFNDNPGTTADDATHANALRDFMAKLGAGVHGIEIGAAAQMFAASGNYAALDALTDYLTSTQKTQADPGDLGRVVREIVFNDNPGTTADDATHANALRDFMAKLGSKVHGIEIGAAAQMFAASGNYAALDALTDYLTATQKTQADPGDLGRVVREIVFNDNPGSTSDDATHANALRDFMAKLGAGVHVQEEISAIEIFADSKNYHAIDAIFGEISNADIATILADPHAAQALAQSGARLGTNAVDTINGSAAADNIYGLGGNDTIRGGSGADKLYGDSGNDWLYGDNDNDYLHGGSGNDVIVGGAGNDQIHGGQGADDLTGGTGADTFVFDSRDVGIGVDRIADFSIAQGDKINISDILDTYDAGDVIANFVKVTHSSGVATLSVDINGADGGANFVAVASIVGLTAGTTAEQLATSGSLVL